MYRSVKDEPKKVFEHFNLELFEGEKIAVVGSNGAGKSTMMKLMTGLLKPTDGRVILKDKDVKNTKAGAVVQICFPCLSKSGRYVYQRFHRSGYCLCDAGAGT